MLLCLALQILHCQCRCKADAKHMQNAECRMHCRMHCRCRLHCRICRSENTLVLSQTACAPEALGRIVNASRSPPRPSLAGQKLVGVAFFLIIASSGFMLWRSIVFFPSGAGPFLHYCFYQKLLLATLNLKVFF